MSEFPVRARSAVDGFGVPELNRLLRVQFSAEQLAAITAPLSPYVVVAGAGSGKTTVMTARVVWLVATGQVRADQVLGLTFTNKAAGELASRVREAVQALTRTAAADLPADSEVDLGEPVIATYHAFAGRLLSEHGLRIGVEPQARLLGEAASYQLAHRIVVRTRRDLMPLGKGVGGVVTDLRALDAELAEHCVEPAVLRLWDERFIADVEAQTKPMADSRKAADVSRKRIELAHLVDDYRAERRRLEVVDFSDQMRFGARLAQECPEVGTSLRGQFAVVLLDEYQDTSVAQRRLLTGLFGAGHPVTAVGDPLQAIYGWRGASVANIDQFPEHFAPVGGGRARELTLAENRRSGSNILDSANLVAEALRALHPQVAPLVAADPDHPAGAVRLALLSTYAEEIAWLADQVVGEIATGTSLGDVALLVRAGADLPPVMAALSDRGVPFEVRGVDGLLAVPEVAEVLAVLDVLHDSTANPAVVRLLAGPRWRVGPRDLALLGRRARQLTGGRAWGQARDLQQQLDDSVGGTDPADVVSLLDALDDPGDLPYGDDARRRFAALATEIRALRRHVGDPLSDLVHRVVATIGLDVELAASPELLLLRRAEALAAFVDLVAAFQDAEGESSVVAFLAWLRLAERYDKVPELERTPSGEAVQLMTIHKAKGLEWPVVVLASMTAGVFPSSRGRSRWPDNAKTLPYPLRGDSAALPRLGGLAKKDFDAFVADCRTGDEREERRLAYVALTRAKRLLIASSSWWGPRQKKARGPSAYLDLLREAALDGAGEVIAWVEAPEDDETNPVLDDVVEVLWPVVPDQSGLAVRRGAAAAVLAGLGGDISGLMREHVDLAVVEGVSPLLGLDATHLETVVGWDDDIALLLEERRSQRSATRVVSVPSSLSTSDLVRLAADPDGFARSLVRPVPAPPAQAARRGTRFHAWVEAHFGVRPLLEPDDLPGAADGLDDDTDEALDSMRAAFLASPWAAREPVAIEVPFALVLGGRVVPGRIDAVFAETDSEGVTRYEVVDWKTSRAQSADPLQLAVYRVAYAEVVAVPVDQVDAAFVYVRDGSVVRPTGLLSRDELEALLVG